MVPEVQHIHLNYRTGMHVSRSSVESAHNNCTMINRRCSCEIISDDNEETAFNRWPWTCYSSLITTGRSVLFFNLIIDCSSDYSAPFSKHLANHSIYCYSDQRIWNIYWNWCEGESWKWKLFNLGPAIWWRWVANDSAHNCTRFKKVNEILGLL